MGRWVEIEGGQFEVKQAVDANQVLPITLDIARSDSEQHALLSLERLSNLVLDGWDEVVDRHGEPIPFTHEHAAMLMLDEPRLLEGLCKAIGVEHHGPGVSH